MAYKDIDKIEECELAVKAAMNVMDQHCDEPVEYRCNQCKQLFLNIVPDEHGTYSRIKGANYFMKCGGIVEKGESHDK